MDVIILDFGSGNTCKNDKNIIKKMYNQLKAIDNRKYKIVVKWQLFEKAGNNIPLDRNIFDYAYDYGKYFDYEVTASIFSLNDLHFLLEYDVPFVKIANNRNLDYLADSINPKIPVYISHNYKSFSNLFDKYLNPPLAMRRTENIIPFFCVSKYPANLLDYEILNLFKECNISDHTTNFALFNKYKPKIVEWHYKLNDSTGLDSGDFARTPEQLKEIL